MARADPLYTFEETPSWLRNGRRGPPVKRAYVILVYCCPGGASTGEISESCGKFFDRYTFPRELFFYRHFVRARPRGQPYCDPRLLTSLFLSRARSLSFAPSLPPPSLVISVGGARKVHRSFSPVVGVDAIGKIICRELVFVLHTLPGAI